MKSAEFNTGPVEQLIERHLAHSQDYSAEFQGQQVLLTPEVFNPTYTKVSGFLARNVQVSPGSRVLEMFSGSGAIGLTTCARARKLVGVDISSQAIACSRRNAQLFKMAHMAELREGNLWQPIGRSERFDLVIANPPLLPAFPENIFESWVADSPNMRLTRRFIAGLPDHLVFGGYALMAFSDACKVTVGDPLAFLSRAAAEEGLTFSIEAVWDVGYEVYRIVRFTNDLPPYSFHKSAGSGV